MRAARRERGAAEAEVQDRDGCVSAVKASTITLAASRPTISASGAE